MGKSPSRSSRTAAKPKGAGSWFDNVHLREWLNVVVATAALLTGIVGLWTTAQVSGLEDYFQSEITRRNKELDAQTGRALRLEHEAEERRQQIDALQANADRLVADGLAQSREYQATQGLLTQLRLQAVQEEHRLDRARDEARALDATVGAQGRRLDLIYRRQAYQALSMIVMDPGRTKLPGYDPRPARSEPVGAMLIERLQNAASERDPSEMAAHVERARSRLPSVCPRLAGQTIQVGEVPPNAVDPDVDYSGVRTQQEAYDRARAASKAYADAVVARHQAARAVNDKYLADLTDFWKAAQECMCSALGDEAVPSSQICPRT